MRHVTVTRISQKIELVNTNNFGEDMLNCMCATTLPKDAITNYIYLHIEPDERLKQTHSCGYYRTDVGIMGHPHRPHHFRQTA